MTAMEAMNGDVLSPNGSSSDAVIEYREVWTSDVIQRVTTILVIMTLTLLGNSFIIYMLTCKLKRRHSRIDVFIVNLAIGDLTVCLVTMTTEILFVCFGEWLLGAVACKLMVYGQIITLASTTFLMTAMSYDRYQAICHPLHFYSRRRALWLVLSCWFASFVFAAPQLFIFVQLQPQKKTCQESLTVADRRALLVSEHPSRARSSSSGESAAHRASSSNDLALVETNSRDFKLRVVFRKKEHARSSDELHLAPQGQLLIPD